MKKLLTLIAVIALATTTIQARNTNLGGYDSTDTYKPEPTYDYYQY
jgi:hypothetical protein